MNPSPNGNGPYVSEAMFLNTTNRIERKVDNLADVLAQALPRIAASEDVDEAQIQRRVRFSERRWAAVLVIFAAFVSSGAGALATLALSTH
jgi:hypothetical protein